MINSYSKQTSQTKIGGLGILTNTLKGGGGSKGGNPYHDALGRFTTGPSTAFGDYNPTDNQVYDELLNHSSRLGLKINPDDIMDNGFSISTKLGAEQVDALARTTLVNDKIKRDKIHQEFIDKESDESQRKLVTDTMNRAGQHITFARNEIDSLVKSIGLDGSKNYTSGMELYAKGARNKIIDSANDSLNRATKYLDSRRSKFGIEGEKYAQKVWTQVETLQAVVNTLKSISNAMGNQPITDTFVQNPRKKTTTTMPKTATLDDLAGMGLIPKPERMNQLQKNGTA